MGVILNRPLQVLISDLVPKDKIPDEHVQVPVFWGGPVENHRGWIVHEDETLEKESLKLDDRLYLSSSNEAWKRMLVTPLEEGKPRYRFFLGYSGWGPGQLEKEIAESSWVTSPLNRTIIFDKKPEALWKQSLAAIGVDPNMLAAAPQSEAN